MIDVPNLTLPYFGPIFSGFACARTKLPGSNKLHGCAGPHACFRGDVHQRYVVGKPFAVSPLSFR